MEVSASSDTAMVASSPTEIALLTMSHDEYMNPVQLAYFQARLRDMREACLRNMDSLVSGLEAASHVADPADRASLEEAQDRLLRLSHRESKLLTRIEAALSRVEAGTDGFCEDTGEPIGLARLLAHPLARLTIEAQQQRELRKNAYRT
jgi:DnaK suppressor protein